MLNSLDSFIKLADTIPIESVSITIEGRPRPKQSTMFARGRAYTSSRICEEQKIIFATAQMQMAKQNIKMISRNTPVFFECRFYFKPDMHAKAILKETGKSMSDIEGMPAIMSHSFGDTDNLEKMLNDGLEGVLYENDSCVYGSTKNKLYSQRERTEVDVYWFDATKHWFYGAEYVSKIEEIREYRRKQRAEIRAKKKADDAKKKISRKKTKKKASSDRVQDGIFLWFK